MKQRKGVFRSLVLFSKTFKKYIVSYCTFRYELVKISHWHSTISNCLDCLKKKIQERKIHASKGITGYKIPRLASFSQQKVWNWTPIKAPFGRKDKLTVVTIATKGGSGHWGTCIKAGGIAVGHSLPWPSPDAHHPVSERLRHTGPTCLHKLLNILRNKLTENT